MQFPYLILYKVRMREGIRLEVSIGHREIPQQPEMAQITRQGRLHVWLAQIRV